MIGEANHSRGGRLGIPWRIQNTRPSLLGDHGLKTVPGGSFGDQRIIAAIHFQAMSQQYAAEHERVGGIDRVHCHRLAAQIIPVLDFRPYVDRQRVALRDLSDSDDPCAFATGPTEHVVKRS